MTTTDTGIAAAVAEREAAVKKAMPFVLRYERDSADTDAAGRAVCREAGDLVMYCTEANPNPDHALSMRLVRPGYSVRADFPPRTRNRDEALEALNLALESLGEKDDLLKRKDKIQSLLLAYKDLTDDDDEIVCNISAMGSATHSLKLFAGEIASALRRLDDGLSSLAELSDKTRTP